MHWNCDIFLENWFSPSLSLWSLDIAAQINSITPRYAFHSNMEMHVKHNVAHAMIKIEMNFVIWFGSNDDKQLPIKKKIVSKAVERTHQINGNIAAQLLVVDWFVCKQLTSCGTHYSASRTIFNNDRAFMIRFRML